MTERGQWVRRFERGGLSRAAFARQHGLSVSTLVRWMAEHAKPAGPAADVPAFREVPMSAAFTSAPWVAEVQRPDGWVVRVNAAALPLVEKLLSSRPC